MRIIISPVIGDAESSLFCEGDIVTIDVKLFGILLVEADSIDIPEPAPRYLGFTGPVGPLKFISIIGFVVVNTKLFEVSAVEFIFIPAGGELTTTLLSEPSVQFITNSFVDDVVVAGAVVTVGVGNRPRIILAASSIDIF